MNAARGGQVYYVYNRVNNIDEITNHVAALVPEANVTFAHGQMHEHELERIMLDFVNGDIDVLVSTTIIETGLDIPNANTIIIHDADRLGLSQLYQIKGRVGRSNRTSYAFLMYRRDKSAAGGGGKKTSGYPGIYGAGKRNQDCYARFGASRRRQYTGSGTARPHGGRGLRPLLQVAEQKQFWRLKGRRKTRALRLW